MAKRKQQEAQEVTPAFETPSTADTYNDHNHETAQSFPSEKQCQCEACKAHRGEE